MKTPPEPLSWRDKVASMIARAKEAQDRANKLLDADPDEERDDGLAELEWVLATSIEKLEAIPEIFNDIEEVIGFVKEYE